MPTVLLTTKVSCLTVTTLVLNFCKAVLLLLRVALFRCSANMDPIQWVTLWSGVALEFGVVIIYVSASIPRSKS